MDVHELLIMITHYRIYNFLETNDILKQYSTEHVIELLERVSMLKIGDQWKISEVLKHTRVLTEKLDIPITQKERQLEINILAANFINRFTFKFTTVYIFYKKFYNTCVTRLFTFYFSASNMPWFIKSKRRPLCL